MKFGNATQNKKVQTDMLDTVLRYAIKKGNAKEKIKEASIGLTFTCECLSVKEIQSERPREQVLKTNP